MDTKKRPITSPDLEYGKMVVPLLDQALPLDQLRPNIRSLHRLFSEVTGITGSEKGAGNEHLTQKHVKAGISVNHAAKCLWQREDIRTLSFLRSTARAIEQVQKEKAAKPMEILYAGCGPYATFLSLIAPLFSSDDIQFTLIEINEVAHEAAQGLITHFGLSPYVREFCLGDATKYKVRENIHFDLLISETLNRGLGGEPLVPILINLLAQLPEDIIVLPENVCLDIALAKHKDLPTGSAADLRRSTQAFPLWRGRVFELKEALNAYSAGKFPVFRIEIPNSASFDYVVVYTEVQVYKEYIVGQAESDFSEPIIREIKEVEKGKTTLEIVYQLSPGPELKFTFC